MAKTTTTVTNTPAPAHEPFIRPLLKPDAVQPPPAQPPPTTTTTTVHTPAQPGQPATPNTTTTVSDK